MAAAAPPLAKPRPLRRGWNVFDTAVCEPKDATEISAPAHLIPDFLARRAFLSYFAEYGLYAHLLESMDELFVKMVPYLIMEVGMIVVVSERSQSVHVINFRTPKEIRRPQKRERLGYVSDLSPREARDRGMTYEATVVLDVVHDVWRPRPGAEPIRIPRTAAWTGADAPPAIAVLRAAPGVDDDEWGSGVGDLVTELLTPRPVMADPHFGSDDAGGGEGGGPRPEEGEHHRPARGAARPEEGGDHRPARGAPRPEHLLSASALRALDDWSCTAAASASGAKDLPMDTDRFEHVERTVCEDTRHFSLPVMVGSTLCHDRHRPPPSAAPWDRSEGYFIINGQEKVVVPQLNPCANVMLIHRPQMKGTTQRVVGEMRPRHPAKIRSTSTIYINVTSTGRRGAGVVHTTVKLPYLKRPIPLLAFCRLVGFRTVDGIARVVALQGRATEEDVVAHPTRPETARYEYWIRDMLRTSAKDDPNFEDMTWMEVITWVAEKCIKEQNHFRAGGHYARARHLVLNEFLPQVGLDTTPQTLASKRALFAALVCRTCRVARFELPPDPRDHFGNMMVELPGILIARLLRVYLRRTAQECLRTARARVDASRHFAAADIFRRSNMGNGLTFAMSTGNWGTEKAGSAIKGVAQLFKRMNVQASISQLRCMRKPIDTMDPGPRQLDIHDWGIACPSETPEGEHCGLVKHMAAHAYICQGRPTRMLLEVLLTHVPADEITFVRDFAACAHDPVTSSSVFVNSILVGVVPDGADLARRLRRLRRSQVLPFDVSVHFSQATRELHVDAENGSVRRPLFVLQEEDVRGADPAVRAAHVRERVRRIRELCAGAGPVPGPDLWRSLLSEGLVEFVSKREEDSLRVRVNPSEDMGFEHREFFRMWATPDDPTGEGLDEFYAASYGDLPHARHDEATVLDMVRAAGERPLSPSFFLDPEAPAEDVTVDFDPSRAVAELDAYHRALQSLWNAEDVAAYVAREQGTAPCDVVAEVARRDPAWQEAFRRFVASFGDRQAFARVLPRKRVPATWKGAPLRAAPARSTAAVRRCAWAKLLGLPDLRDDEAVARRYWEQLERIRCRDLARRALIIEATCGDPTSHDDDRWEFTHCEIHPTAIHSLVTALIVFSDRNQAPRNTFQDAIGKAAIGVPQEVEVNHSHEIMPGTQMPMVQTIGERMLNPRSTRSGYNAIVAIMCHRSDNVEDSLYMCREDFERGLARTWHNQTYTESARTGTRADTQTFEQPGEDVFGKRDNNYSLLTDEGYAPPGTIVGPRDVVIGKTIRVERAGSGAGAAGAGAGDDGGDAGSEGGGPAVPASKLVKRDQSVSIRDADPAGIVGAVLKTEGSRGRDLLKVNVQRLAVPFEGDKFSSRHGQKGTIGRALSQTDMPWGILQVPIHDEAGNVVGTKPTQVRPNIIVNAHSQPSRMTAGMLTEMLAGMCGVAGGYIFDGTSFDRTVTPKSLEEELARLGLPRMGEMQLFSGETGEPLGNSQVYVGVCFYQRLKQRVLEKARALDHGKRSALTRQPTEGKHGGLRLGEMERDGLIAHGATSVVLDSFLVRSDDTIVYACTKCRLLASPPRVPDERLRHIESLREHVGFCTTCKTSAHIVRYRAPYALKLFQQELMALGIAPRVCVRTSDSIDFANAPAPGVPVPDDKLPMLRDHDLEVQWQQDEDDEEDGGNDTVVGLDGAVTTRAGAGAAPAPSSMPPPPPRAPRTSVRVDSLPGGAHVRGPDLAKGLGLHRVADFGL